MNRFRSEFRHLIGIDILYPYAKYKKSEGIDFEKIIKVSILGQKCDVIDPKKGDPMHQSRWWFHHLIDIDVPFHHKKFKKNCRPILKNCQNWFSWQTYRQTDRQTYRQRVSYRTFPFGGSKIVGTVFEKINITKGRFWGKNMTSLAPKRGKQCIKRHGVFTQHGVFTIWSMSTFIVSEVDFR